MQQTFFDVPENTVRGSSNPMVRLAGKGLEGKRRKTCKHCYGRAYAKTYYKCGKRGDLTHGKATDQKLNWPACSLYEDG